MINKFVVTEVNGVKQVGFNGLTGLVVLDIEEIVDTLNSLDNTRIKLEERVAGQLKLLEVAGKRIESLEDDLEVIYSQCNPY